MQVIEIAKAPVVSRNFPGQDIWETALGRFTDTLNDEQKRRIGTVTSLEELIGRVEKLQKQYAAGTGSRWFDKLAPVLTWLTGFNHCVHSFVQASPPEFALVWGALSLVLEVAAKYIRGLEQVVEALESARCVLPRFGVYASILHNGLACPSLKEGLVKIFVEFIGICQDSIAFFSRPWIVNFLAAFFRPLKEKTAPRLQRIQTYTYHIDQDAAVATQHLQIARRETQHSEIIGLLSPRLHHPLDRTMLLGRLPFRHLPSRRNPAFFGRTAELEQLWLSLAPNAKPPTLTALACYGLAGSGKTQLALEFVYRHLNSFDAVLWVAAETRLKMEESFRKIALGLGVIDDSVQQPEKVKDAMKGWFTRMGEADDDTVAAKWLLVFDNVDDASIMDPYWPQTPGGAVMVTCRDREIAHKVDGLSLSMEVEPFTLSSAAEFLLGVLGASPSQSNEATAIHIAKSVGNHPLALDLIGGYIRKCGMTMSQFIRQYPTPERDILFHESSIANLWAMYLSDGKTENGLDASARLLIQMLALLDGDGAPLSLFTNKSREDMLCEGPDLCHEFPHLGDILGAPFNNPICFDRARSFLLGPSLARIERDGQRMKCHRLVQIAVAKSMGPQTLWVVFHQLVFFLNASFPQQADGRPLLDQWEKCEELASQVQALLESYRQHKEAIGEPVIFCEIICRCSWYFYERGQYERSLKMVDDGIAICERALARGKHPGYSRYFVTDMVSHLANAQAAIFRDKPAVDHGLSVAQKVLDIRRENLGLTDGFTDSKHWFSAAQGNLAVSLMGVDRDNEALDILLALLERDETRYNEDIYLDNAALCLSRLGRLDEAAAYVDRAMESIRVLRGENTARMAICYFYLSGIERRKGNIPASIRHLQRCLDLRKQHLMPHHHHTGFTHHQMGVLLQDSGNHLEAVKQLTEAYEILSSGECHPGAVCRTALALAQSYRCLDDPMSATCLKVAEASRVKIRDVDTRGFGNDLTKYDRFVTVGLR